jgi:adenine-specific DNA-methyltransferase
MLEGDTGDLRKERGAFFTPYPIAEFLVSWALSGQQGRAQTVLDPTSGEGVFLLASARRLRAGNRVDGSRIYGVDTHQASLEEARRLLSDEEGSPPATLLHGDFFDEPSPDQLGARIPLVDAVVGNPPFVRYHEHRGEARRKAASAALARGVRLSGLASSWAAQLVHASSFLKPDGRIAMVLPAELLSVGYAEPIRLWLRKRFQSVHLVLFDRLQFAGAEEQVVLLVARGTGGCNAFTLHEVKDAQELAQLHIFDADAFAPRGAGKWTDLLLPEGARGALRRIATEVFGTMRDIGTVELGTVTGANHFFALSEATRKEYDLVPGKHVVPTVPPGSRHIPGVRFTKGQWEQLKLEGERVWLLSPSNRHATASGLLRYISLGKELGVHEGYKCSIREPWWKAPAQPPPDLFFTYMSHVTPRMIENLAQTTLVNSMHGVRLHEEVRDTELKAALPLLALNTVTMLSAEITGRSYGGGILKLEPREAADLAIPKTAPLLAAWAKLKAERHTLDELARARQWPDIVRHVDAALLTESQGVGDSELVALRAALIRQRARRQRREQDVSSS